MKPIMIFLVMLLQCCTVYVPQDKEDKDEWTVTRRTETVETRTTPTHTSYAVYPCTCNRVDKGVCTQSEYTGYVWFYFMDVKVLKNKNECAYNAVAWR